MNVYNIKEEFWSLKELSEDVEFDSETGEVKDNSELLQSMLDEITGEAGDKVETLEYIKNGVTAKEYMIDKELARLKVLKKGYVNNIASLSSMQKDLVELSGGKIETDLHKFGLRKSESVNLTEFVTPDMLPEEYQRKKTTIDADKTKIKKALKEGIEIKGCELQTDYSLSVK